MNINNPSGMQNIIDININKKCKNGCIHLCTIYYNNGITSIRTNVNGITIKEILEKLNYNIPNHFKK